MEENKRAINYLKKLRNLRSNSGMCDLVYRSPAQQLRESADRIESEEALIIEIDEFLSHYPNPIE